MLSTSFEFREKIAQNSKTLFKATLTLADGTVKNLTGDDIMMGSATFADAVSSDGSFDIGAAIINQFSVTLNNYDRRFDEYDFTDSTIVPYVGVQLDSGGVEWLNKGRYGIDQPESYGSTIGLDALDNMRFFERPYNEVNTAYPATLRTIVNDVCRHCGVTLANANFANSTYVVQERPVDDALTCIEVIAYAAQASGNYARVAVDGRLVIDWYNTDLFEGEDWLDGKIFDDASPYASGSTADGGNFINYNSGDVYDGGEFGANVFANIHAYSSAAIITDDVVITGVAVTAQGEKVEDGTQGEEGETSLYGTEGYVLAIEGNPLIQYGRAATVAAQVGARVVGMRFRPFDLSAVGNPAIEAGDPVIFTDRLQNQYFSYITSLTYKVGNYEAFACSAESPGRNKAASFSAATKAYVKLRNAVRQEKTAREQALEELARELTESAGLYMTQEEQSDRSVIYYMHDKPTLPESRIVWKLTANAFGISTDGGATYPYGLDVNGTAILNRIYAIGLDADYIDTGAITIKNGTTTVFSADLDTKQVVINGDCVTIGSESVTTAINGVRALYGTCTTAADTAAKVVTCSNFTLRAGAVVNVKFTYKNTASNPTLNVNGTGAKAIHLNNAALTSAYYWNAQDVITFVYSGSYWYIADAGTLAKIKATADSITLSVSQTYATKSELTVGLNSISLSVSNAKLGSTASITLSANGSSTTKTIDLTGVRNAFKNDSSAITISAGTVTFNSNTIVISSTNFSLSSTGVVTAKSFMGYGTFQCGSSSGNHMIMNSYGELAGYQGSTKYGYIDYSASARDLTDGSIKKGMQMQASQVIRISSPKIAIAASSNVGTAATWTKTGTMSQQVVKSIKDAGGGSISWTYGTFSLAFINGLCTSWGTF